MSRARIARIARACMMVEVLAQDDIRTARAKGLRHMALTVAGLSLNLLGDGLRDTLDPRGAGMVGGERR